MSDHTGRHEDGCGAGWAKEQWISESLHVRAMVAGQMQRHLGVPRDVHKDRRGVCGQKNREFGQGTYKAQRFISMSPFSWDGILPTPLHPALKEWGSSDIHSANPHRDKPFISEEGTFLLKLQSSGCCPLLTQAP